VVDIIYQGIGILTEMNVPEEAVKDPEPSESKRMKFSFARDFKDMLNMKLSILLDRCKLPERNARITLIATLGSIKS
jgi:hypothetical protein